MAEEKKTGMFSNMFSNIKGDLFGGLTAGIVALPLALAFGLSSGLGPDAGLYGAIFIAFFAALFGGTDTQISGPTAPMTALSMIIIAGIIQANNGDVQQAIPAILTVFLLAGLILVRALYKIYALPCGFRFHDRHRGDYFNNTDTSVFRILSKRRHRFSRKI